MRDEDIKQTPITHFIYVPLVRQHPPAHSTFAMVPGDNRNVRRRAFCFRVLVDPLGNLDKLVTSRISDAMPQIWKTTPE